MEAKELMGIVPDISNIYTDAGWSIIEEFLQEGKLVELEYQEKVYYMRKLPSRTETNDMQAESA